MRMRRNRREKMTYNYECSLTGEQYVTTAKAPNPKDLISVKAYYDMHPEMDDRPAVIKKKLGIPETNEEKH
jgi:hypothetical protein